MGACSPSRVADLSNDLSSFDPHPLFNQVDLIMGIDGNVVFRVAKDNQVPVSSNGISRVDHFTGTCRFDGCSGGRGDIHSLVPFLFSPFEEI